MRNLLVSLKRSSGCETHKPRKSNVLLSSAGSPVDGLRFKKKKSRTSAMPHVGKLIQKHHRLQSATKTETNVSAGSPCRFSAEKPSEDGTKGAC